MYVRTYQFPGDAGVAISTLEKIRESKTERESEKGGMVSHTEFSESSPGIIEAVRFIFLQFHGQYVLAGFPLGYLNAASSLRDRHDF